MLNPRSIDKMKISKHFDKRSQQNAISPEIVDFLLEYGTPVPRPGGAEEYRLAQKTKKQIITRLKQLICQVNVDLRTRRFK
jgi:hypothetical protein